MTISRNLSILAEGVNSSGVLAATNGGTGVTTSTGSGSNVLSASPTFSGTITFPGSTTIDSSGNVGIGTSSPGNKLDVAGNQGFTTAAYVFSYAGGTSAQVRSGIQLDGTNQQTLFFTGTNERMRIDSSGNVGVGTTVTSNKLNVYGSIGTYYDPVTYPAIRGYISHTGNTGGFQINAQGANNSTFGAGNITFWTPSANSANGSTDATLTEKMRIDSSGNVGIGTSSPNTKVQIYKASSSSFTGTSLGALVVTDTNATSNYYSSIDFNTSSQNAIPIARIGMQYTGGGSYLLFGTSNNYANGITNTAMVIDSSGNLLVGTTTAGAKLTVQTASQVGINSSVTAGTSSPIYANVNYASSTSLAAIRAVKYDNNTTTSQVFIQFAINQDGANNGQINANGASAAAFGTYSDERLKENIVSLPSQLSKICALRPVEFDYKDGSGHQIGFVAQEMQQVYPDVVGEREDGMLTVTGWSKTEARLVAAIQELSAKNDALEARLAALETP